MIFELWSFYLGTVENGNVLLPLSHIVYLINNLQLLVLEEIPIFLQFLIIPKFLQSSCIVHPNSRPT